MKYKENQRFRRTDVLLLLIALIGGVSYRLIDLYILNPGQDGGQSSFALLIILSLAAILTVLLSLRLITKIDDKGIRFLFYPWHYKTHKIDWDEIAECRVIDIPLQAQWSGLNVNITTNDLFYSFTGRKGLELRLTNGQQIFIGSRNPQDVADAIQRFMPEDSL